MATPEGVECSPALACLGKGFCRNQKCERSDAGPWLPAWSAQIAGTPVGAKPALLANNNGVFFEACDVPVMTDAGAFFDDAGTISDSGVVMTLSCALSSYTRSGFDRFVKPFSDGARRRLVQVSNEAVVMLADAGLEWRSPSTGEVVQTLMTSIAIDSPRAVAGMRDGTVVIALPLDDGGTRIIGWSDAGVTELASPGFSVKLIALDENEGLVGFDPVTGSLMLPRDSGVVMLDRGQPSSLITANGVVFAGIKHLVRALDDGGTQVLTLEWSNDAGQPFELDSRTVLMGQGASVVFYRRCSTPMMSCLDSEKPMFVRAFDSVTGAMQYEAQVLPEGDASLEEAALIGTLRGAVAAFVHGALDAGSINAGLEVFIDKQSPVLCPLPERVVKVRGALFWAGRLFVLDDRGATGSTLQAFDLGALPLLGSGWSSADGFGATRRAGP